MLDSSSHFRSHIGFTRAFVPNELTLGFILPLEAYPNSPVPTMEHHAELTKMADNLGFAALWARDVPTYDPTFGDVGQVFDPFTYLGFLAANTKCIALATGAAVVTLRHPVHVAKQASSIDVLSGSRMLLGVASGDRPAEYPLFSIPHDYESRGERFQEAIAAIRMASENSFPVGASERFGQFLGNLDVLPKPTQNRLPIIVVGRSRQALDWIARNADAWLYYFVDAGRTELIASTWRQVVKETCGDVFKPFAQGLFFDLLSDPNASARPIHSGMAAGRNALVAHLEQLRNVGVNHVAFNLKASRRPVREVLQELGEFVLPQFASGSVRVE